MAIFKNVAGQKVAIYAHDTANDAPKTGDAGNITAQISKDGAATAATDDTNPTELDAVDAPGIYLFDLTQAEANGDLIVLSAVSATADVSIEPVVIYTLPTWAASQVAQTIDNPTVAEINATVDAALVDYDGPTNAEMLAAFAALNNLSAAEVWAYATRTLTANVNGLTIVSAVSGNTITVYQYDTWLFTLTDSSLALGDYDNLIFVVKERPDDADDEAILFLDITAGLKYIGKEAASGAGLGSLTKVSATSFTVQVEMSEVAAGIGASHAGTRIWWLKGIDVDDDPDQGFVLATGSFVLKKSGARAVL